MGRIFGNFYLRFPGFCDQNPWEFLPEIPKNSREFVAKILRILWLRFPGCYGRKLWEFYPKIHRISCPHSQDFILKIPWGKRGKIGIFGVGFLIFGAIFATISAAISMLSINFFFLEFQEPFPQPFPCFFFFPQDFWGF